MLSTTTSVPSKLNSSFTWALPLSYACRDAVDNAVLPGGGQFGLNPGCSVVLYSDNTSSTYRNSTGKMKEGTATS